MYTLEVINKMGADGELKGMYEGISNEVYHTCCGLSKSALLAFDKDPVKYHYRYILGNQPETTSAALEYGKMFHECLLEPEKFNETYRSDQFAFLLGNRNSNKYKNAVSDYLEEFPDRILIKEETMQSLLDIKNAANQNPIVKKILDAKGKTEQTIFWTDPTTKILCKLRFDKLCLDLDLSEFGYKTKNFLFEFKSATDVFEFEHSIAKYKYYLQDAWYKNGAKYALGIKDLQPIFIAIDKEPPYFARIGQLDIEAEGLGEIMARSLLGNFSIALQKGFVPDPVMETFSLPDYEFRKHEKNIQEGGI